MVPCETDAQCRNECPTHWLTGYDYVCMKNYSLYDHMYTYTHPTREPTFNNTIDFLTGMPAH